MLADEGALSLETRHRSLRTNRQPRQRLQQLTTDRLQQISLLPPKFAEMCLSTSPCRALAASARATEQVLELLRLDDNERISRICMAHLGLTEEEWRRRKVNERRVAFREGPSAFLVSVCRERNPAFLVSDCHRFFFRDLVWAFSQCTYLCAGSLPAQMQESFCVLYRRNSWARPRERGSGKSLLRLKGSTCLWARRCLTRASRGSHRASRKDGRMRHGCRAR